MTYDATVLMLKFTCLFLQFKYITIVERDDDELKTVSVLLLINNVGVIIIMFCL